MSAGSGDDSVYGSNGEDNMIGDSYISSSDGNDRINGGDDEDLLVGYGGSDNLDGGTDSDTIEARELSSRKGTDTVKGGSGWGRDLIYADDGAVDKIDCGDGTDEVYFDSGIDVVAANCENRFPQ